MSDKDFELLLKMIGMTGSDNDNQALVAMRKANDLAAKLGGWDAILRGKVKITVLADPFANIKMPGNAYTEAPRRPAPSQPPPQAQNWGPIPTPPPPPWSAQRPQPKPQPKPQTQPQPEPAPVINKYEGTCTTCKARVGVGQGLAYKSGGRWHTRHNPGQCPTSGARKAFTADDLQV